MASAGIRTKKVLKFSRFTGCLSAFVMMIWGFDVSRVTWGAFDEWNYGLCLYLHGYRPGNFCKATGSGDIVGSLAMLEAVKPNFEVRCHAWNFIVSVHRHWITVVLRFIQMIIDRSTSRYFRMFHVKHSEVMLSIINIFNKHLWLGIYYSVWFMLLMAKSN